MTSETAIGPMVLYQVTHTNPTHVIKYIANPAMKKRLYNKN